MPGKDKKNNNLKLRQAVYRCRSSLEADKAADKVGILWGTRGTLESDHYPMSSGFLTVYAAGSIAAWHKVAICDMQ
jgi:hypothetical protein